MTPDEPENSSLFAGVADICEQVARHTSCDGAAVAVLTRHAHTRELVYATDPMAVRLDELQYTLGEGPCLDAYLYDAPQFYADLDDAAQTLRWPTFATEVTRLGVHSLFAYPISGLRHPMGPSGVLELYRRAAGALTDVHDTAARDAANAIAQRLQQNWNENVTRFGSAAAALDAAAITHAARLEPADPFTRSQIHVAAGILAYRLGIHPDDAVDRLRAHAYGTGHRLSAVAADVIARRLTLPDQPDPPPR